MKEKVIAILIRENIIFTYNGGTTITLHANSLKSAVIKELVEAGVSEIRSEIEHVAESQSSVRQRAWLDLVIRHE